MNAAQRKRYEAIVNIGCIVGKVVSELGCSGRITIHHCFTGAGGRKDHASTIPLCWEHHLGKSGIDGKSISKRAWQAKYTSEGVLLAATELLLREQNV